MWAIQTIKYCLVKLSTFDAVCQSYIVSEFYYEELKDFQVEK